MNTKSYYLAINAENLSHYFSKALILPRVYINAETKKDIQDNYSNFLLLTDKQSFKNTNVLIQIILLESEYLKLDSIENIYLYNGILPISRIKKVFFETKEQMEQSKASLNISTAFIDDDLFIHKSFQKIDFKDNNEKKESNYNYSLQIDEYDRVMGAISLMRLGKEDNEEYSKNYFSTISFFNKQISKDYKNNFKDNIETKFHLNQDNLNNFLKEIRKEIKEEDLVNIPKDNITKKINFSEIKDNKILTKTVLYNYGVGNESRKENIDSLVLKNFKIEGHEDKNESLAFYYGYNRGYSVFSKSIKEHRIKFKMDSKLDYSIVESIFQYVFNDEISGKLEYLDFIVSQNSQEESNKYIIEIIEWFKKFFFTQKPDDSIKELIEKIINHNSKETNKVIEENKNLKKEIERLKLTQNNLNSQKTSTSSFNEEEKEKERILIELTVKQTLDLYKNNKSELQNIAKNEGLKYTKSTTKSELVKLIYPIKDIL